MQINTSSQELKNAQKRNIQKIIEIDQELQELGFKESIFKNIKLQTRISKKRIQRKTAEIRDNKILFIVCIMIILLFIFIIKSKSINICIYSGIITGISAFMIAYITYNHKNQVNNIFYHQIHENIMKQNKFLLMIIGEYKEKHKNNQEITRLLSSLEKIIKNP